MNPTSKCRIGKAVGLQQRIEPRLWLKLRVVRRPPHPHRRQQPTQTRRRVRDDLLERLWLQNSDPTCRSRNLADFRNISAVVQAKPGTGRKFCRCGGAIKIRSVVDSPNYSCPTASRVN